jgi:hypothetical protein
MVWTWVFDGSEVQTSERLGGQLRLVLSAASVYRATGPLKSDVEAGYLKPVELVFFGASWTGDLPWCMGTLSGGVLTVGGIAHQQVALPLSMPGPVQAEFNFRSGAVLTIHAASVEAACPGEPRFMPSYAC